MSGLEAWNIVAPILASHLTAPPGTEKFELMSDVYITVYMALKKYEEEDKHE